MARERRPYTRLPSLISPFGYGFGCCSPRTPVHSGSPCVPEGPLLRSLPACWSLWLLPLILLVFSLVHFLSVSANDVDEDDDSSKVNILEQN